MNKKKRLHFSYKSKVNGLTVEGCQTHSIRRFFKKLRSIKWDTEGLKVYIKVSYGKEKNVWGKTTNFYNDGMYMNREELFTALNCFLEDD